MASRLARACQKAGTLAANSADRVSGLRLRRNSLKLDFCKACTFVGGSETARNLTLREGGFRFGSGWGAGAAMLLLSQPDFFLARSPILDSVARIQRHSGHPPLTLRTSPAQDIARSGHPTETF